MQTIGLFKPLQQGTMSKCLLLLLLLISQRAFTQHFEISVYGNYVFNDHVNAYQSNTSYYDGQVKGGFLWGAGLEYRFVKKYGLELMYMRMKTNAPIEFYDVVPKFVNYNLTVNYIMLAGMRTIAVRNEKVEPYFGLLGGACIADLYNPDKGSSSTKTKFALGARGGAIFWVSKQIGLKVQAQYISIPQSIGGGFYFGTGGTGTALTTYSTMNQFALGGGVTFKIGKAKPSAGK